MSRVNEHGQPVEPLATGHAEALWAARRCREWVEECNARTVSLPYALVPTGTGTAAGVASFFRIDTDHGAPGCSLSSTAGRCSR